MRSTLSGWEVELAQRGFDPRVWAAKMTRDRARNFAAVIGVWVRRNAALPQTSVSSALTAGSNESTQTFDDSAWPLAILFGWPGLYWAYNHGVFAL